MRRKEKQAQTVPLLGPTGQPTHPRQELITPESLDPRNSAAVDTGDLGMGVAYRFHCRARAQPYTTMCLT